MRTKLHVIMKLVLAVHIVGLLIIGIYADNQKVSNTLFIIPTQSIDNIIDYEQLEDKNGEDFLITYETTTTATIRALNRGHEVALKGTNYLYAAVMSRQLISGAFFTKAAQDAERRVAVLNKAAAFELFGSYDISGEEIQLDGEIFTVTGVVDDKDKKNLNIYIPQCYSAKSIESVVAMFESSDATPAATVENGIKQYNISSTQFNFYNLNDFTDCFSTKLLLSLSLSLLILFVFLTVRVGKRLANDILQIKNDSGMFDLKELLYNSRRQIVTAVLFIIAIASLMIVMIILFNNSLNYILGLQSIGITMITEYTSGLPRVIYTFNQLSMYSLCILISFSIISTLNIIIMALNGRSLKPIIKR